MGGRSFVRGAFGHADEHPYRRLTADLVKLPLAAVLVVLSARHVGDESVVEQRIASFFAGLPHNIHPVLDALTSIGTLWGVALLGAAALVARRYRLAAVLALGGALAWFLARFIGLLVLHEPIGDAFTGVFDGSSPGSYPAVHLAVVAAVVVTAAPYLTRPIRRTGHALVVVLAFSALTLSVGGLNDVVGALVLAWAIGAALHLAFGSPAGRPTAAQVAGALAELNFPVGQVVLAPEQSRGFTRMIATTASGEVVPVRVYGRDAADTRLAAKVWRFLAYKDSGPTLTLTRLQQVEHEALCMYAARDAGASVPGVLVTGVAGPSAAVLVTRVPPDARPLMAEDPRLADQLGALWSDLGRLREHRIAHGGLDLDHVAVTDPGSSAGAGATVIADFSLASVSAPDALLDQDVAQLLIASSVVAGEAVAVAAAVDALGAEAVALALPYLQKPALSAANRRVLAADKKLLDRVRDAVTSGTGEEPAEAVELRRIKPLNIVMFLALLVAVWVVLGQVGSLSELWETMRTTRWGWLLLGLAFAASTSIAWAFTTIGTVRQKIALVPATLLQMAVSFANLVATTGAASTLMNIRFLQKQGVDVGPATSSGLVAGASGTVAQFGLFVGTGLVVGQDLDLSQIGGAVSLGRKLLILAVASAAIVAGVVVAVPRLRRWVRGTAWPQVKASIVNIREILTSPRQVLTVLGGSVAANLLSSACLFCCLLAYGDRISFVEIVFVNTSASFITGLVPVPGGVGIAEAALVAGLTAFGVPAEVATATVVMHRLFTSYLPPIWGSQAMKWLVREGYL